MPISEVHTSLAREIVLTVVVDQWQQRMQQKSLVRMQV